uniref:Neurofilament heavy polypeptide-like n=1 Tax=Panagrellus redivivus TaxID=6233 RepID=A0A7E4W9Y7_PANRE
MADNSGSGGVRKTTRKKNKATQDDAGAKTVGSNEGIQGANGNSEMPRTKRSRKSKKNMEKTQDSTEFEPVHVASRPAVSKNKVKRNLWDEAIPAASGAGPSARPPSTKDRNSGRALPGSGSGSNPDRPPATVTGSSGSSGSNGSVGSCENPANKMKKRLRESAKLANGKTEEEDTIFQKVKGGQKPAIARMRSHKDRKSKERISKRKEKEVASLPTKMRHRKKIATADEEQPTRFEVVHADSRPAIVIEKPRRKGSTRKENNRKSKPIQHTVESPPIAEAGETIATVEEKEPGLSAENIPRNKNAPTPESVESPGNGERVGHSPEPRSTESVCPNAKMVSIDSPANCEEQEKSESSNFVEEMDVPELPGYQFEIWKASSKPKLPTTSVMLAPSVAPASAGSSSAASKEATTVPPAEPAPKARSPTQKSEYYYKKY